MTRTARTTIAEKLSPVVRTAIYVRVSTSEQAGSGLGLEAQRESCEAMVTKIKHWAEPTFFGDEGLSGTLETAKRTRSGASHGGSARTRD